MRIGIVGTRWGLMHVGGFRGAGAEVVALCGRDLERTREVARREGVPLATTDVAELCATSDLVVVASPDGLHREHVATALGAGRPVLCEKPLTRTVAEAEDLLAREERAGRPCAVSFPYRLLPPIAALRTRLRGLGPLRHAAVTVLNGFAGAQDQGPAGPMMGASGDFGGMSHLLDAALWLGAGAPRWVEAVLGGRPVHSAALHIELEGGAVLSLAHLLSPRPGIAGRWQLIGADWQAEWAGGYEPELGGWRIGPVRLFQGGSWTEVAPLIEPAPGTREPWAQAHVEGARAFLRLIQTGARGELATFAEGALVQRVLAAAMCAEAEGRRISLAAAL